MSRSRYNRKGWPLCRCKQCGRMNYCEPHGTTAACRCSGGKWVEHENDNLTVHVPTYRRRRLGQSMAGGNLYGWSVACSCGWSVRLNGHKREVESFFYEHVKDGGEKKP